MEWKIGNKKMYAKWNWAGLVVLAFGLVAINGCFLFESYELDEVPKKDDAGNDAQGDANQNDSSGDTAKPECTKNEECTTATKPVCELTTKTCRAATRNADCVDSAVEADGSCHNKNKITYVDNSKNSGAYCMNEATGTLDAPYCTIQEAYTNLGTKDLILIRKGNGYISGLIPATIEVTKSVRIAGTGEWVNGKPVVVLSDAISIKPSTTAITVTLDELNLVGSNAWAAPDNVIECWRSDTNSTITLQARSLWVEQAKQVGLRSNGCAVSIHGSVFTTSKGRGLSIKNTTEKGGIFNSMIIGNGSDNANAGGIELAELNANFFLAFNTFADNQGKVMVAAANDGYGLKCSGTAKPVLHASLMIPTAGNTNKTVDGCTVTYSAIDAASSGGAMTNVTDVDPTKLTFKNAAQADYHITGGDHVSKLRKKWTDVQGALPAGFKAVDYDGDARDKRQDNTTDIGADHVAP